MTDRTQTLKTLAVVRREAVHRTASELRSLQSRRRRDEQYAHAAHAEADLLAQAIHSQLAAPLANLGLVRTLQQQLEGLHQRLGQLQRGLEQTNQDILAAREAVIEADRDAAVLEKLIHRAPASQRPWEA